MRKNRVFLVLLSLLFILSSSRTVYSEEEKTYNLYFDITFKENAFLDRYDVQVFLDNEEVGEIKHGTPFTSIKEVSEGKHEILISKKNKPSVSTQEEIIVQEDCTYRVTISAEGKMVKINQRELIAGLEGAFINMPDVTLRFLPDALNTLKETGFIKIEYKSIKKGSIDTPANWIVLEQSIKPGEVKDKNDEIILSCQKRVDFVKEHFEDKNILQAVNEATKVGYEVSFVDSITGRDLRNDFMGKAKEDLELWVVSKAESIKSNQKVSKLTVAYTGSNQVPNVLKMSLSSAILEMRENGFSNLKYKTVKDKTIDKGLGDEWKVVTQSIEAGIETKVNDEIILVCEPYKELSEQELFTLDIIDQTEEVEMVETETKQNEAEQVETEQERLETENEKKDNTEKDSNVDLEMETEADSGVRMLQKLETSRRGK